MSSRISTSAGTGTSTRRNHAVAIGTAVAVLAVLAAVVAVVGAGHRPASMDRRVQDVTTTLRCPTCNGESVAASNAPIAQSMRAEVRRQLAAGRTPAQIRSWFEDRYGADVVTLPDSRGPEMVLWALPVLVLCAGGALALGLVRRRGRSPGSSVTASALSGRRVAVAAGACLAVGAVVPAAVWARTGDGQPDQAGGQVSASAPASPSPTSNRPLTADGWSQVGTSLESQHDYGGAVRAYRHALRLRPGSAALRTRLGFDLLRAGRPHQAVTAVRQLSERKGPDRPMALLVLGLAQRTEHDPAASRTLRTFLTVAPDHPAAAQVRRLLAQDG